jgi:hypothetical protein
MCREATFYGGISPLPRRSPVIVIVLLPLPPVPCLVGTLAPVPHLQDRVRSRVVDQLYSIQYKSIFVAPSKVRWYTCDKARPLSQV